MILSGQLAIVTGGSRGIGFATAAALAGQGARVALVARNVAGLKVASERIGAAAISIACDLTDERAVARAVSEIGQLGDPAILINNAGIFPLASFEETDAATFSSALQVNLLAPFLFARSLLPGMRARKAGHIVTIGSIADRNIFPGNAAYAATKFGARAMHEVLRAEVRGSGVRATLVSPGPVDTEIWDPVDPDNRPGFTPRAAMLSADAVADAVLYALTRPAAVNVDELRISRS